MIEEQEFPSADSITIDPDLTWFAAYTQAQSEFRAAIEIQHNGLVAYCPSTHRTVERSRRKVDVRRPLFPRYVFAGCLTPGLWGRAKRSRYVEDLVRGCGGEPVAIHPAVVQAFHEGEVAGRFDHRRKMANTVIFSPGQSVRVVSGPYSQFVSQVVSASPKGRVEILMAIFGGVRAIRVPANMLEAVNDDRAVMEGA